MEEIKNTNNESELGNSNGNLVNGGDIANQGDWLYFSSNGNLYKSKLDGSQLSKIYNSEEENGVIGYINVVGSELFFSGGNGEKGGLYKISSDGTELTKIISDTNGIRKRVYVIDEWISYDKEYILRCDGNCSDKEQIAQIREASTTFNIDDGYMYYCGLDINDEHHIYKAKIDGSDMQEIYDRNVYGMLVEGGWIYYHDNHVGENYKNMYKMKTDGTENQLVSDEKIDSYNIKGDWIYYTSSKDGEDALYKMKTDGTESQKMCSDMSEEYDTMDFEAVGEVYIFGDWIYCHRDDMIQRVKIDGTSFEVIFEESWVVDIEDNMEISKENKEDIKIDLNNTYETCFGDENMVTYPKFAFDFPSTWDITNEVTTGGETATISNERGVEIVYSHISGVAVGEDAVGGSTVFMSRVEATKVESSSFVPSYVQAEDYSSLGEFVVAKLKVTGEMNMMEDSNFIDVDGAVSYAVLPESQLGVDDAVRNPYNIEFGFSYADGISFIAYAPEDGFTEQEEKLVIEILKSFRVVE